MESSLTYRECDALVEWMRAGLVEAYGAGEAYTDPVGEANEDWGFDRSLEWLESKVPCAAYFTRLSYSASSAAPIRFTYRSNS